MKSDRTVKPHGGWTMPRTLDKRPLTRRIIDGCRAFHGAFRREPARVRITHFSGGFIGAGGGGPASPPGSARITTRF